MKKLICAILAIATAVSLFVFPVSAGGLWTIDEENAGFRFDFIYVIIKPEYSFNEFSPEDFDAQLVERIEELFPYNPEIDYEYPFRMLLEVYLKEPSKENVLKLLTELKENEYVENIEANFINGYIPIFPESPVEIPIYSGHCTPWIMGENAAGDYLPAYTMKNMLFNPYYQKYYNELLAGCVATADKFIDYIGNVDYIGYYADECLSEDIASFVTLIFKENSDFEGTVREYNMSILENGIPEKNILYVGDTVPAAVVMVSADDAETLKSMDELVYIAGAFFQPDQFALTVTGQYLLGDVISTGEYPKSDMVETDPHDVTAADARYILRYCAGLEDPGASKRFYYCADVNLDDEITAADARLALRIAAGLDSTYKMTFGYASYWHDDMIFPEGA